MARSFSLSCGLLVLVARHALQPAQRRDHRQQQVQFGVLRHLRLHEQRGDAGIQSRGQPVDEHLLDEFRQLTWCLRSRWSARASRRRRSSTRTGTGVRPSSSARRDSCRGATDRSAAFRKELVWLADDCSREAQKYTGELQWDSGHFSRSAKIDVPDLAFLLRCPAFPAIPDQSVSPRAASRRDPRRSSARCHSGRHRARNRLDARGDF